MIHDDTWDMLKGFLGFITIDLLLFWHAGCCSTLSFSCAVDIWDLSPKWLERLSISCSRQTWMRMIVNHCTPFSSELSRETRRKKLDVASVISRAQIDIRWPKAKNHLQLPFARWFGCGSGTATSHWLDINWQPQRREDKMVLALGRAMNQQEGSWKYNSLYFLEWCTGCALATKSWTRLQFRFKKPNQHLIFPMSQPWMVRLRKKTASTCYSLMLRSSVDVRISEGLSPNDIAESWSGAWFCCITRDAWLPYKGRRWDVA